MTTDSPGSSALNERRRLAVKLRLEGRKLKEISELVDLSSPTIISAHKQFIQGGWQAVDARPRGRPARSRTATGPVLETLREHAFDHPNSNSPWTQAQLAETAAKLGTDASVRTIGNYIESFGLGAVNLHKQCKSQGRHNDWLNTEYKNIVESARKADATIFWAGHSSCENTTEQIQKYLYAHTTRGKYFWLAGNFDSDAQRFIEFFTRLSNHKKTQSRVIVIWQGHDPQLTPELSDWINQSPAISFFLHPEIQTTSDGVSQSSDEPQQTSNTAQTQNRAQISPASKNSQKNQRKKPSMSLTHLQRLEAESIHIMREVIAEADKPVMLYSIGKDSAVMLHLAQKAFYPAKPPFPLLHVDTGWKFQAMYDFRDKVVKKNGLELLTHKNPEGVEKGVNPFTHGSGLHTDIMKTQALRQALDKHGFDVAFGGARRDEEKSRAKERVFSFRTEQHTWDPKNQRPELWNLYNTKKKKGQSIRVFPLSNWTELDIWQYIYRENIELVPLYFAADRPVVLRDGTWIMVDDDRMPMNEGEVPLMKKVRFRTLGCYPLTGAIESSASTVAEVVEEMLLSRQSERQGRMIDHDSATSMEKKKQEGYF